MLFLAVIFAPHSFDDADYLFIFTKRQPIMPTKTSNATAIEPIQYLIDLKKYALPGAGSISDIRLAALLSMERDQSTDLLRTTINGAHYVLQITGKLIIEGFPSNLYAADFAAEEAVIAILEGVADVTLPCFVWLGENNVFVGQPLVISLDAAVEVARFAKGLSA